MRENIIGGVYFPTTVESYKLQENTMSKKPEVTPLRFIIVRTRAELTLYEYNVRTGDYNEVVQAGFTQEAIKQFLGGSRATTMLPEDAEAFGIAI